MLFTGHNSGAKLLERTETGLITGSGPSIAAIYGFNSQNRAVWNFNTVMSPKEVAGLANSGDPDQTAPFRICKLCADLYDPTLIMFSLGSSGRFLK